MKISIQAVATYYSPQKRSIKELSSNANKELAWGESTGIKEVHIAENGQTITGTAALAAKKALNKAKVSAEDIDQLVFISEGISDYIYMDTSKEIIRKIGGRTDGDIHSNDFFRGCNGTIGFIRFIGNQILSNPSITTSLISTSLMWERHSNNRLLGQTFLGDGAGALILNKDMGHNQVISTALASMSQYNKISGFKYGGTRHDFTDEVVKGEKFVFDILDESHLQGVLNNIVSFSIKVGEEALIKSGLNIDYIGISGFNKYYNDIIREKLGCKAIEINSLETKGYLGTAGVIEILDRFLNDNSICKNSTLLVIAIGIDINVEAMVIRK